jgi:hypothetical protein
MSNPGPNVFWYGERGIINAVVAHVRTSGNFVGLVRNLLAATCWGTGSLPSWIETFSDAHLIVEVGLADFGDPDLIIVCRTEAGLSYVVFLEAKAQSYRDSMQSTSPSRAAKWGMKQDGFNSSINGQLTLKYRFANALSSWDGRSRVISESRQLFQSYQRRLNDSPTKSPGRSLAKASILDGIFLRLGVAGIAENNCHYIALTWDCKSRMFFNSSDISSEYLPVFLGNNGEERFSSMLDRVGWIGFKELEDALGLSDAEEYKAAFATMLGSPEPTLSFYPDKKQKRWESFPAEIIKLGEDLAIALEPVRVQRVAGSYSMKDENNQTVGKIIPNRDSLFIGLREEYAPLFGAKACIEEKQIRIKSVQGVNFVGMNVTSASEADKLIRGIKAVIAVLPEPAEGMLGEVELP